MKRILLIKPPTTPSITGVTTIIRNELLWILFEPLELELLAAAIPHHNVEVLDMRIDKNLTRALNYFNPDIVGVTCYTTGVYLAKQILKDVKEYNNNILNVVGGHHATLLPEDFNEEFVDVIVIGQGEITFKELVDTYDAKRDLYKVKGIALREKNGKLVFTDQRIPIKDLDELPLPNRDLVKKYRKKYHVFREGPVYSMEFSRGCPYRCTFCSVWKSSGDGLYLTRSAESIVDEISKIEGKLIWVGDPNPTHDIELITRIITLLKKRKIQKSYILESRADTIVKHPNIFKDWAEVGLKYVLVGFESFREEDLKIYHKGISPDINIRAIDILHRVGINPCAQFIVNPDFTEKDFKDLKNYVLSNDILFPAFVTLTPLPGSNLFYKEYDRLISYNYELFDLIHCLLPTSLPRKKFYEEFANLYRECFSFGRHFRKYCRRLFDIILRGKSDIRSLTLFQILGMQISMLIYLPVIKKAYKDEVIKHPCIKKLKINTHG